VGENRQESNGFVETLKIAILAFACDPSSGTEAGLGWNWAQAYSESGNLVHVFTHETQKEHFELSHGYSGINVIFLRTRLRKSPSAPTHLGELISMSRLYRSWLKAVHNELKVSEYDLIHHVSWSTARIKSPVVNMGSKGVWGPIGGGHLAKISRIPLRDKLYEFSRNLSVILSPLWIRADQSKSDSSLVLTTNDETKELMNRSGFRFVKPELADGISVDWLKSSSKSLHPVKIKLFWAGRLVPSKRPDLAIQLIRLLIKDGIDCELKVAGIGNQSLALRKLVQRLKLGQYVTFLNHVGREEIQRNIDSCDFVLFTSFRDSSSPIILEGAARGTPSIAIRNQGVKSLYPEDVAIGPTGNQSLKEILEKMKADIVYLKSNPKEYEKRSRACLEFAKSQLWIAKVNRVISFHSNRGEFD
jgi:glycosyltransferase involved in cell wall biosynthesis